MQKAEALLDIYHKRGAKRRPQTVNDPLESRMR